MEAHASGQMSLDNVERGARLFRRASSLLTGGADAHQQQANAQRNDADGPTETTPLIVDDPEAQRTFTRQPSTAEVRRNPGAADVMQARLQQDVLGFFERNQYLITIAWIFGLALFAAVFALVGFFIWACYAAFMYSDKPCDQPLKYYVLATIVLSQVVSTISNCVVDNTWSVPTRLVWAAARAIPGWCLMGWGYYMVTNVKKCDSLILVPTKYLIYLQIGFAALNLILNIVILVGYRTFYRHFALYVSSLEGGAGCAKAVHALPKIEAASRELVGSDGSDLACPICLDALTDGSTETEKKTAVKTPCSHYFHEECLAEWCKNRLDCPMCRGVIGAADETGSP